MEIKATCTDKLPGCVFTIEKVFEKEKIFELQPYLFLFFY